LWYKAPKKLPAGDKATSSVVMWLQPHHHRINHTDVFLLTILTTVTLESTNNALYDDTAIAPKHVGAKF